MKVSKYAKAAVSGIAAGSAAALTAAQDSVITTGEGVTIALAVLGAWGITWAVPNKTAPKEPQL
jgi:hypothetical protein